MDWIRTIIKTLIVLVGLLGIYVLLSQFINSTNKNIQKDRDATQSAAVVNSYISLEPFGEATAIVKRDTQVFYNMQIQRVEGSPCYVRTSWRWILRLPTGNSVMWNKSDGEFFAGDKNENLAQAIQVPSSLIPGDYTLSRLSSFKCGDVEEYAKSVRNTDLRVE